MQQSFPAFWLDVNQNKYLEILGRMKCSDILCSYLVHKRKHRKQWKLKIDKRKLRIVLEVSLEVTVTFPDTQDFIEKKLE